MLLVVETPPGVMTVMSTVCATADTGVKILRFVSETTENEADKSVPKETSVVYKSPLPYKLTVVPPIWNVASSDP